MYIHMHIYTNKYMCLFIHTKIHQRYVHEHIPAQHMYIYISIHAYDEESVAVTKPAQDHREGNARM